MNERTHYRQLLVPGKGAIGITESVRHSHLGRKGDLIVELHYGDFGTGHGREAALCLYRHRLGSAGPKVYVPLSCLWMYVEGRAGQFNDSFAVMIPALCARVYGTATKAECYNMMDAIVEYLDALRKAPPDVAIFRDNTLKSFLAGLNDNDLEFWVEVGGKRTTLN
ncbi:MAG: hypothetical protein ACREPJ_08940 [Rhodanobacteraceae bacterium]